jgi:hypothetical protein
VQETIKIRTNKIQQIKRESAERINDICPAWKQSNLNARANELNAIRHDREWTSEEQSEWAQMMDLWQSVKQIRIDSNIAENTVNGLNTIEEIEQFSW